MQAVRSISQLSWLLNNTVVLLPADVKSCALFKKALDYGQAKKLLIYLNKERANINGSRMDTGSLLECYCMIPAECWVLITTMVLLAGIYLSGLISYYQFVVNSTKSQ